MNIVRMTWVGAAGVSAIALILGGGACSSSSGGGQAGDSGTGSDVTMGDDSSSEDSGQADTGSSSGGGDTGTSSGGGDTGTSSGGGDTGTSSGGGDSSTLTDSGTPTDSGNGCSGSTPVALTVMNFDSWCSVTVAGGTASTGGTQTVCVAAGPVTVVATPASSSFEIGADPWFGIDQNDGGAASGVDNGSGTTETSTATVTVTSGSQCVSVCCEFANNGGGCPATNPCP